MKIEAEIHMQGIEEARENGGEPEEDGLLPLEEVREALDVAMEALGDKLANAVDSEQRTKIRRSLSTLTRIDLNIDRGLDWILGKETKS